MFHMKHFKNIVKRIMENNNKVDVVVIGGGHAGCEAASASARMGVKTFVDYARPKKNR